MESLARTKASQERVDGHAAAMTAPVGPVQQAEAAPAAAESAASARPVAGMSGAFAAYAERLAAFEKLERWRERDLIAKRILDCVLCIILFVLCIPLIALAAIWVKLTDPGPAFYSQERIGMRGERFRILKVRTMYSDADARLRGHLEKDPAARAEWKRYVKLKNDPRLLPVVGPLLRKSSIDELPQLWNVLRGDMSLVGPRPFSDNDLEHYDRRFLGFRETMRPGITGLWQIYARGGDVKTKASLDTYYLRNWSIWLDIFILLRTPSALLKTGSAC